MDKYIEKPVPVLAHKDGQTETQPHANENSIPKLDYSTPNELRQPGIIEKVLPCGAENAVTTKELLRITGYKKARDLQHAIAIERENGALILSASQFGGGYFLPDEGEKGQREIADFVHTLHTRAINTLRILRFARQALSGVDGQMEGF